MLFATIVTGPLPIQASGEDVVDADSTKDWGYAPDKQGPYHFGFRIHHHHDHHHHINIFDISSQRKAF